MNTTGYIALSRQMGLFKQLDVIANNIANVDSTAYKGESILFSDVLRDVGGGEKATFSQEKGIARNFEQGALKHTGRQLDAAIDGKGFFAVETPLGIQYTRAGSFHIDSEGTLVTSNGYPVLGDGASIQFTETDVNITIAEDGTIKVKTAIAMEERGKLDVVKFPDDSLLQKVANNMYISNTPSEEAIVREDFTLAQGMIETSNVNPIAEMTKMIKVSRAVGSTSKLINDLHELQRRTVSVLSQSK